MPTPDNAALPLKFDTALAEERKHLGKPDPAVALTGLALSGGGIRSATFNLGVLQALAQARLLGTFDYLSTVSGGGYIGSWLSAWIRRAGGVEHVENELGGKDEPAQVRYLREFSNVLTPKRGTFGADTQTWVATYLRNLILNLAILLSVFAAALLLPYFTVWGYAELRTLAAPHAWMLSVVILVLLLASAVFTSRNLSWQPPTPDNGQWYAKGKAIYWLIIVPACLALWLMLLGIERLAGMSYGAAALWFAAAYALFWFFGGLVQRWLAPRGHTHANDAHRDALPRKTRDAAIVFAAAAAASYLFKLAAAGAAGGCLFKLAAVGALALSAHDALYPVLAVSYGFPLLLGCAALTVVLHIGLVGRGFSSSFHLEWWARLGAWTLITVSAWIVFFTIALFGPPLVQLIGAWAGKTFTAAWVAATVSGVLLGKSRLTGGTKTNRWLETFVRVAPYVFILGLALLLSYALSQWLLGPLHAGGEFVELVKGHAAMIATASAADFAWVFAGLVIAATVLAVCVNVNLFSLFHAYRMRLIRAYLGASNAGRQPQPYTDFDRDDDVHLSDLTHTCSGTKQRPLHLINTALNLVRGQRKAWQQRKSASFVFTPLHTGYSLQDSPCQDLGQHAGSDDNYRPTGQYATNGHHGRPEQFSLGSALTISGAAVSPNMGYHSSAGITFLLTVFNIRLGRWCPNPSQPYWRQNEPKASLTYLMMELLGLTDSCSDFVYLSDGGHFENLGVYELVRRRCQLILVCDCGEDHGLTFDDLANAQRKCATDLGVRIDIDVSPLRRQADGYARVNFAIGQIHYGGSEPGLLVLLKPVLTGREATDILNYASVEKDFPQVSTLDQWFNEAQFESYRKLGLHVGTTLLREQPHIAVRLNDLRPGP
jgi:Patatin-like phospholipase